MLLEDERGNGTLIQGFLATGRHVVYSCNSIDIRLWGDSVA